MTDALDKAAAAAGADMTWDKVRQHLHDAIIHELPQFGGHARYGPTPTDPDAWRRAAPEQLAEAIVTCAMAGIGPVLFTEQVGNGIRLLRGVLDRAGIDPATLDWHG